MHKLSRGSRVLIWRFALMACVGFGPSLQASDDAMAAIDFPTFHASWENDTRTISRGAAPSDRFYTNGVRVALTWAPADDQSPFHGWAHALLSRMPFNASEASPNAMANGYGYAIGQNMYTPSRIDRPDPDPRDRPYAGWLYAGVLQTHVRFSGEGDIVRNIVHRRSIVTARSVEFDLGMIGPASGAAESQKWVHSHLCECIQPQGWGTQLKNELGAHAGYDWSTRRAQWYRLGRSGDRRAERERLFDLTTSVGASVGNIFTNGRAGGVARLGWNLPDELAPDANIRSFDPGGEPAFPVSAYGYVRGEGRAVLRNVFLDGNLFRAGPRVDHQPMVADCEYGFVIELFSLRGSWRRVLRSPEFVGQAGSQAYGVLNLSWNLAQTVHDVRRALGGKRS